MYLGIDVGGTKVAVGLVSPNGGSGATAVEPVDRSGGAGLARQIVRLVRQVEAAGSSEQPIRAAGIALPAVLDAERRKILMAPNAPAWDGFPLAEALEEALQLPVILEFDAHAAALGEAWVGVCPGVRDLVLLIVGTGVGAGLLLDGRVYRGASGVAGAVGWSICGPEESGLDPEIVRRVGALEAMAAGPAIERRASPRSCPEIVASAGRDPEAAAVLEPTLRWLERAVANLVSTFNPEWVVFSGGVGTHLDPWVPRLQAFTATHAQPVAARRVRVAVSGLGKWGGLVGAARAAQLSCPA